MTGWLIVNEYLNNEKFKELQDLFLDAAEKKNVELRAYTNAEFVVDYETGEAFSEAFSEGLPDFVIFYDKDISLAIALEGMGLEVFNSASAIETCDSKALTAECVCIYNQNQDDKSEEITVPLTFKVPFTYENIGIKKDADFRFLDYIEDKLESAYPMIIKESYSSFGMGVHLAHSRDEAIDILCKVGNRECVIQEFVESAAGTDVRLQMVGDEVAAAMMRTNDHDFRSNITNGGCMSKYEPTEADIELARKVMRCLSLDFAGIDIMHDEAGNPIFIEANSNAHFKNLYDLTGINVTEKMIDYIASVVSE